jgi:NADH dehydrogenase FAD-containing subunit
MIKLVVIGGGFAGSIIARRLEQHMDVTLVDTKEYFEFTPGILRALVQFNHLSFTQVPHANYLHHTRVIVGTADHISNNEVRVGNQSLPYDYLVIATGSRYASPIKDSIMALASRADELHNYFQRLESAQSVLIIGGGLVGVELAAEIVTRYPSKKVILVHAGTHLLERNTLIVQRYATKFLRRHKVEIHYGQMVTRLEGGEFITDSGQSLTADLAFMCTGLVPNNEVIKASFAGAINERGYVRVNKFLQLIDQQQIFAVGDVNDCGVEKTAQNAQRQAKVAIANILALEAGQTLRPYPATATPMVISLGSARGIFTHHGFTLTGFIPALMKAYIERREMRRRR